jgi:hypothetical protein
VLVPLLGNLALTALLDSGATDCFFPTRILPKSILDNEINTWDGLNRPFSVFFIPKGISISDITQKHKKTFVAYGVTNLEFPILGVNWCKAFNMIKKLTNNNKGLWAGEPACDAMNPHTRDKTINDGEPKDSGPTPPTSKPLERESQAGDNETKQQKTPNGFPKELIDLLPAFAILGPDSIKHPSLPTKREGLDCSIEPRESLN